jgi:hypothetical protein
VPRAAALRSMHRAKRSAAPHGPRTPQDGAGGVQMGLSDQPLRPCVKARTNFLRGRAAGLAEGEGRAKDRNKFRRRALRLASRVRSEPDRRADAPPDSRWSVKGGVNRPSRLTSKGEPRGATLDGRPSGGAPAASLTGWSLHEGHAPNPACKTSFAR